MPKIADGFDAAAYLAWEETQPGRNEYVDTAENPLDPIPPPAGAAAEP